MLIQCVSVSSGDRHRPSSAAELFQLLVFFYTFQGGMRRLQSTEPVETCNNKPSFYILWVKVEIAAKLYVWQWHSRGRDIFGKFQTIHWTFFSCLFEKRNLSCAQTHTVLSNCYDNQKCIQKAECDATLNETSTSKAVASYMKAVLHYIYIWKLFYIMSLQ